MSAADLHRLLRRLPSVDDVLRSDRGRMLLALYPRWAVLGAARREIEACRRGLLAQPEAQADANSDALMVEVSAGLEARAREISTPGLRRVLNATGVVLHTNLGRAPLSARAIEQVCEVARGYCTLEYDPAERGRGSRQDHLRESLAALTGAESALVVNNNAGAVLLALAALAAGRDVIVSRGELVEIGGGFRVPDVMRASGARLVEVGTTNKTRLADYLDATGPDTALFLKVHRSNFAVVGFTEEASLAELASTGRQRQIPVMVDLGSGAVMDLGRLSDGRLGGEPTVPQLISQGADVVTFSGDKLLGGPQAGILVGRGDLIDRIGRHPLMRALRPDKMTLAALDATLYSYRSGTALDELPALRMLVAPIEELAARKDDLLARLRVAAPDLILGERRETSAVGGGALPLAAPETWVVTVRHRRLDAEALARQLLRASPPLVVRIAEGEVLLDVRTLAVDDLDELVAVLAAVARDEALPC